MRIILIVLLSSLGLSSVLGQSRACTFDLGPDRELCQGTSVLLAGPSGAVSTQWQNGGVAQYITADSTGTYWCTATFPLPEGDVVVNGDFSQGDWGFTTDLTLGNGGPWGPLSNEGTYGVSAEPVQLHNNFARCEDHSSGDGPMLVVNGSGQADAAIWCQTVVVQPGALYAFSAWLTSVYWESPANLEFTVNGTAVGAPLHAASSTCAWEAFHALWSAGTNTTATICITNQNLAISGNDFALDDIAFRPLCTHTDSVVVVEHPPAPDLQITGHDRLCPGETTVLEAALDGLWPFTDVLVAWDDGGTGTTQPVTAPGIYEAVATGQCLNATATFVVGMDTCTTSLEMPNIFTPNGDGHNDTFLPITHGRPRDYNLRIYNRWGQEVFSSTVPGTGWDGRLQGAIASDGTYFWLVRYGEHKQDGQSEPREQRGHLTLLGHP